jgi:hypothetical protein
VSIFARFAGEQGAGPTLKFRFTRHRTPDDSPSRRQKFLAVLIKPSHYDDDGYVIQWWRGWIPSNSLSSMYGLALDVRRRQVLGDGVEIEIEVYD